MSLSENRSHFSGTCVKSGLCHDCRFRHQTGATATALTHPAADEVCATDRVLGSLDGMGESQPLKPQIGRCRNALIAGSRRRFAHLFSPPPAGRAVMPKSMPSGFDPMGG